jgi:hypothetical protein
MDVIAIEKEQLDTEIQDEFSVVLEESASTLTQGVTGKVFEAGMQRYQPV